MLRTAIVYDFDGTLSPGSMQEHGLFQFLDIEARPFWAANKAKNKDIDGDEILSYMHRIIEISRNKNKDITYEKLKSIGQGIKFFDGVSDWFQQINDFGQKIGLEIEHYVISSGLTELIDGCEIRENFKEVYACKYEYDQDGKACWPSVAINYTNKTQYLFRINKGINNHWDGNTINRWMPMNERPIPFSRMIFLGDGDTDIPAMKMVKHQGGYSIAVFDPSTFSDANQKVYN